MAFNFPNSPTVGQLYQPNGAGVPPVYRWDGTVWQTQVSSNDKQPLYSDGSVPMQAGKQLTLSSTPPAAPTDAANKNYVDATSSSTAATTVNATAVRFDAAQPLISIAQGAQARQNIWAAPFDALAYNGIQINGGMEVAQQYGTNVVTVPNNAAGYYVVDQWQAYQNHASLVLKAAQYSGAPGSVGNGMSKALMLQASTAATIGGAAGDVVYVTQPIEGNRTARLLWGTAGARPVTIAFWMASTVAGTIAVCIRNGSGTRSFVTNVTCAANTWEYKTLTVPGCTDGSWLTDTGVGMWLDFCFGSGATYRGASAGAWLNANALSSPQTSNNLFATANATIYLTGVIMLPGIEVPPQDRASLILRPFAQELDDCMRYFEKSYDYGTTPSTTGASGYVWWYFNINGVPQMAQHIGLIHFKKRKRIPPVSGSTAFIYSQQTGAPNKAWDASSSVDVNVGSIVPNEWGMNVNLVQSNYAMGFNLQFQWLAMCRFT